MKHFQTLNPKLAIVLHYFLIITTGNENDLKEIIFIIIPLNQFITHLKINV